jgi:hypothetical protein
MAEEPPPLAETAAELRAKAQQALKLARYLPPGDPTARSLLELAAQWEAKADALERRKTP